MRGFNRRLEQLSLLVSKWSGSIWAFALALLIVIVWAVTGPFVGFSDTWQLVINTGTTIVTFLMVFLVQRAQNKESLAIQTKLDELIASQPGAWNHLIKLEDCSEDDIQALRQRFDALAQRLERAADECDSHSIVEAKDTVNEPAQPLAKAAEVHRS